MGARDLTQSGLSSEARITERAGAEIAAIAFDDVSFAFDDHVVLQGVSFRVPAGSMRFLLGASGSGKSILLKLILGLFRSDSGTITVNGQRIDNMRSAIFCACALASAV